LPGVIWVNVFFALSFLMAIMASILQAVAEEKCKRINKMKTETNCLMDLWWRLWKVQTEAYSGLSEASWDKANFPAEPVNQVDNTNERQVINFDVIEIDVIEKVEERGDAREERDDTYSDYTEELQSPIHSMSTRRLIEL